MANIPNLLTVTRIILIPVIVVLFYMPLPYGNYFTMFVFLIAVLTDWLDGVVARKLQQTSNFGTFLDPVADKLLVSVVLIVLLQINTTIWLLFPVIIIISREILRSAANFLRSFGIVFRSGSFLGKDCQIIFENVLTLLASS